MFSSTTLVPQPYNHICGWAPLAIIGLTGCIVLAYYSIKKFAYLERFEAARDKRIFELEAENKKLREDRKPPNA
jgi:hypothetical protein